MITSEDACSICLLRSECQPHSSHTADYLSSPNRNMTTDLSRAFQLTTLATCRETTSTLGDLSLKLLGNRSLASLGPQAFFQTNQLCWEEGEMCVQSRILSLQLLKGQFGWNKGNGILRRRGIPEKTITYESTIVLLKKRV